MSKFAHHVCFTAMYNNIMSVGAPRLLMVSDTCSLKTAMWYIRACVQRMTSLIDTRDTYMSWVRVPPEAVHFFLGKLTTFGVLCCFALFVCLTLLAFLLISHSKYVYTCNRIYIILVTVIYQVTMQCASSMTRATILSWYTGRRSISLHWGLDSRDSGLM